jgi:hypothetical protein
MPRRIKWGKIGTAQARLEAGKTSNVEYKIALFFSLHAEEWLAQEMRFWGAAVVPRLPRIDAFLLFSREITSLNRFGRLLPPPSPAEGPR